MDKITKLQDEALLYLRDNITKDEAYYVLTTENEMTEVLIAKKEDGGKRIKILDMEYTIVISVFVYLKIKFYYHSISSC